MNSNLKTQNFLFPAQKIMNTNHRQHSLAQYLSSQSTPNYRLAKSNPQSTELFSHHPYLPPLQALLQQQLSLQLPTTNTNVLTSVLGTQLKQFMAELKIQQMKMLRVREEEVYGEVIENSVHKIVELNEKIAKVKEFYVYCRQLKNSSSQLAEQVEKYYEYAKKQSTIVQQLQNYLNNPIISDVIFRQYLKTYNVNIFTSDLISHYFQLNLKGLLNKTQTRLFEAQRIPELVVLQKQNVVFKQLYDINLKYTELQQDMKHSYINNIIFILSKHYQQPENCQQNLLLIAHQKPHPFESYNNTINLKLENLNYLISKMTIMGNNMMQNVENTQLPILVNEYEENYTRIMRYLRFGDTGVVNKGQLSFQYKQFVASVFNNSGSAGEQQGERENLKSFFENNLIFEQPQSTTLQTETEQRNQQKFEFLQQKIIKTQSLIVMNKIFSTLNMFSYILEQINPGSCRQAQYTFSSLKTYVQTQFRGEFIKKHLLGDSEDNQVQPQSKKPLKGYYHSPSHKAHFNVFIETDEFGNWMLLSGNQKLIYPSAIGGLVEVMHYMVQVATLLTYKNLYSHQLMLQILSLKAQQISKTGQVIFNIYNLIKSKQVSCYSKLNDYIKLAMRGFLQAELKWLQNMDLTKDEHQLFMNQLEEIQANRIAGISEGRETEVEREYERERKRVTEEMHHARVTKFLTHFAQKAKKADFLSQIIYQLDSNYQISPVLQQLLLCQHHHHTTFYFHDNPQFYETVLYEIIQMRNHIKLDHYFTLPRLHEAFGFFTVKALSFGDILNKLATYSVKEIRVEELLRFFGEQLRLKRLVFRGELYWLSCSCKGDGLKTGNSFKQFVQDKGKEILTLAEEGLDYFLKNIDEFTKKVSALDQEIEKFKHFQTIVGKMNQNTVRVKNIDSHLPNLSSNELSTISKILCAFNPINHILLNQPSDPQLFSDLSTSIQTNNRIKFDDINKHAFMFEQKEILAEMLFTMKCFGFQLGYGDCFAMFVQSGRKSYMVGNYGLKMVMNRERTGMVKHYQEVLVEDKKNVHVAIQFYKSLIMVALLAMRDENLDQEDKTGVEELLKHVSRPFNIIQEIRSVKQIFTPIPHSHPTTHQLYRLLRIKSFLKRLQSLTNPTQTHPSLSQFDYQTHCIQTICMIAKLSLYTQKRIVQKLQNVHYDVIERQTTDGKVTKELSGLNQKLVGYFLGLMTKWQQEYLAKANAQDMAQQQEQLRETISPISPIPLDSIQSALASIEAQFHHHLATLTPLTTSTYNNKQQLTLFSNHCGYKVTQDMEQQSSTNSLRSKELLRRNDRKMIKKALFSPVRSTHAAQSNIMQNIQKRVGIEMIKESMGLRKVISKLQLEEKKMKDEIAWETSKLEHNVIKKIHAFITQSNMDQEQSYINFKYTVNLQTIKGMQNVIKEQTELAIKASEETMKIRMQHSISDKTERNQKSPTTSPKKPHKDEQQQEEDFFVTNLDSNKTSNPPLPSPSEQQTKLGYQNSRMLNTNIDSIFNHMRKIKIFAAWKKVNRNMDLTNEEWKKFNKNVANLLHNEQNIKKIETINRKRSDCFKENILCSLLKQENSILSEKIRNSKLERMEKVVGEYKKRLVGDEGNEG